MSILRAAGLIALVSLFSKFIGLLRDIVFAHHCGLSAVSDAYNTAYLLPGSFALLMMGGLNGPFHSAIVATLTHPYEKKDFTTYRIVLVTTLLFTLFMLGGFTLAGMQWAPTLIQIIGSTLPPQTAAMAAEQLRIMFPMFVLAGLIGISYGVLSIHKSFFTPSFSPVMASLAIIVGLTFFARPDNLVAVLAWSTLIGAGLQLLLQMIPLFRRFQLLPLHCQLRHPTFQTLMMILFPAVLSSTVGQLNLFIIYFFAGGLETGSISAFQLGNRLIQLPLGILLTALLVPLLPALAGAAKAEETNYQSLIRITNQGLRAILLISIPITLLLMFFSDYLVALVFQRGAFEARDTQLTYQALLYLAVSICVYATRDLLIRVFYALEDSKVSFFTTFISIGGMLVFSWLFSASMGVGGISLAASLATYLNFVVLSYLLYRRIGPWVEAQTWQHLRHHLWALVPAIGLGLAARWGLNQLSDLPWLQTIDVVIACLLYGLFYIGALALQKDQEIGLLRQMAFRMLGRVGIRQSARD